MSSASIPIITAEITLIKAVMKEIRIATRASKLALAQANEIMKRLSSAAPDIPVSIVEISTKGDRDKSDFLYKADSVGFFTSEVEQALLDGRADVAVHSLKDLPTEITKGLAISAIPQREQVNDVIVAAKAITSVQDLSKWATVGTSSVRRISQLKLARPDLDCQPLRGNVETRINKIRSGELDAIVVAQAGLNRLGMSDPISLILPPEDFIPAPGQGALAIQTREDNTALCELVHTLDDPSSRIATQTERRILAALHGGCSIPLGVFCRIEKEIIYIQAILCNLAATKHIRKAVSCPLDKASETADYIVQQLLNEGGKEILDEVNNEKQGDFR
ncbi:MAG: hydroxymethylbilane synthase [Planctomycetota bacterium]|nr:MAG: hydroxymethylbilane synthase [Planctomycetota bacterium]